MRPLRVLYPGAVYHVTARGNERRPIFEDPADRTEFLGQLELAVDRYGWLCHGYCLMGNHYHLLIETPRANLPIGMRHLNGCYGQGFNRRHQRVGHLFQGRYKAEVVEKLPYLLELVRYLALNPTRTKPPLGERPEDYRWSSYPALLGLVPAPRWLLVDWVLSLFGADYDNARQDLRAFVESGLEGERLSSVGGIYLGGEQFVSRLTTGIGPIPEVPRAQWQPLRPSLNEIFSASDEPIVDAYRRHGYTMREIAAHLGCHYQTVSRRLRVGEQVRDRET